LKGVVAEAINSPYANYVIQKIITVLSPQEVPFVVEEIQAVGPQLACHEYFCRVFCRLLENTAADESTKRLIDSMLTDTEEPLLHTYGHFAVECVLEHGLAYQQSQIVALILRRGIMPVAQRRTGAHVLESALKHCSSEDKQALALKFLETSSDKIVGLTDTTWGCMVLRAMLCLSPWAAQQLCHHLSSPKLLKELETTRHGRRLLEVAGLHSVSGGSSSPNEEENGQRKSVLEEL